MLFCHVVRRERQDRLELRAATSFFSYLFVLVNMYIPKLSERPFLPHYGGGTPHLVLVPNADR